MQGMDAHTLKEIYMAEYMPFETKAVDHYYSGEEFTILVKGFIYADETTVAMEIKTDHEYIYITKEQAMSFFDLIERN
jgi:hypothetical protein